MEWLASFAVPAGVAILCGMVAVCIMQRGRLARAHQNLRDAKREMEQIARLPLNNPHPLMQVSVDHGIMFANPAALSSFPDLYALGLSHPVLENIPFHLVRASRNAYGTTVNSSEISYKNSFYQQTIITSLSDKPTVIVYCHDITPLKLSEQQLEHSRQAAEAANEAKSNFLANISHELRTPMNGIIGLSDVMMGSDISGENREMAEAINGSANSLLLLLNDVLDIAKIESGGMQVETVPCHIRQLTAGIHRTHKPVADKKGIAFDVRCAADMPDLISCDPAKIAQILNNLVSNAIKFTAQGAVLMQVSCIGTARNEYSLMIRVSDTGIGIPPSKHKSIFTKFTQADLSTTRRYGGTGLGLAIVSDLTEFMGGSVHLESDAGSGAVFTVTLPVGVVQNTQIPVPEKSPVSVYPQVIAPDRHSSPVLVVDDHPVNRLFMRKALARLGFDRVDDAENGADAIAMTTRNEYGIIFMDCQMPGMDGYAATGQIIRNSHSQTRPVIIALTADAMPGTREKCLRAGMNDYLAKPVNTTQLRDITDKWLKGEKMLSFHEAANADLPGHSGQPFFDWSRIDEFTQGNIQEKDRIIALFLDSARLDLARMEKAAAEADYSLWMEAVHKLYGAAVNIGATSLAALCEDAQGIEHDRHDTIATAGQRIREEFSRLDVYLCRQRQVA